MDMQAASTPMAEELAYTYQRADGTVERARNAEDAIARCPVLGKLAIEAPDQASILLELAAAGNAKMAAEIKEEPKKPAPQELHSEPKPTKAVESDKKVPESSPEQIIKTDLPLIVSNEPVEARQPVIKADNVSSYHAGTERIELQRQETLRAFENAVEPVTGVELVSEKSKVEAPKEDTAPLVLPITVKAESAKPLELNRNASVDLAPLINLEVEQRRQQNTEIQEIEREHTHTKTAEHTTTPVDVGIVLVEDSVPRTYSDEAIVVEPDESTVIPEEMVDTLEVEYETADTEMVFGTDDLEAPDFTLDMDSESSTEFVNQELEAENDENMELLFEPETIETYLELRDLIAEQMDSETASADTTESEASVVNELDPVENPAFEAFVTAQPLSEEVALEAIKAKSSEQPLEQTLIQLVEYVAYSAEVDEQLEPLLAIIKDIEKSLPTYYFEQKSDEITLQITPEMTDKLLTLLRELGYQNPREALISMVNKFGFAFLLQSLTYLFQSADEDNRRELLSISVPTSVADDKPLTVLSKLILKLVMGKELIPDSLAA